MKAQRAAASSVASVFALPTLARRRSIQHCQDKCVASTLAFSFTCGGIGSNSFVFRRTIEKNQAKWRSSNDTHTHATDALADISPLHSDSRHRRRAGSVDQVKIKVYQLRLFNLHLDSTSLTSSLSLFFSSLNFSLTFTFTLPFACQSLVWNSGFHRSVVVLLPLLWSSHSESSFPVALELYRLSSPASSTYPNLGG